MRLLDRLEQGALAPERIERLVRVVEGRPGPAAAPVGGGQQAGAVGGRGRAPAVRASSSSRCRSSGPRSRAGSRPSSTAIDAVVTGVLERAGVGAGDVDTVFATGGSSLVPAVRAAAGRAVRRRQAGRRRGADVGGVGARGAGAAGIRVGRDEAGRITTRRLKPSDTSRSSDGIVRVLRDVRRSRWCGCPARTSYRARSRATAPRAPATGARRRPRPRPSRCCWCPSRSRAPGPRTRRRRPAP